MSSSSQLLSSVASSKQQACRTRSLSKSAKVEMASGSVLTKFLPLLGIHTHLTVTACALAGGVGETEDSSQTRRKRR